MKRTLENEASAGFGDDADKKARVEESDSNRPGFDALEGRFLIEKRSMGLIIGKGGSRINALRAETGVFASILKLKNGADSSERILSLKGNTDQIAAAMKSIAALMVESAREREEKTPTGKEIPSQSKFVLLFEQTQAGAVIGKQGSTIKNTQAVSGARMQVSKESLPSSTERSVTITGEPDAAYACLTMVLSQLCEFPSSVSPVLYVPGAMAPAPSAGAPGAYGAPQYGGYGQQAYGMPPQGMYGAQAGAEMSGYGAPPAPSAGAPPASIQSVGGLAGSVKQQIAIPTSCAGGVIGKGGSRIREIQAQTQTVIQIAPVDTANPNERIVSISGSQMGIQAAIAYISETVESEYRPPAGALPGSAPSY